MADTITLRGGFETTDARLDRLPHQDPRSLDFPISSVVPADVKHHTWALPIRLDQGKEGACVGNGVAHRLAAAPVKAHGIDEAVALSIYQEAKTLDPFPGEDYDGTTVLAGVQAAQKRGFFGEYRWAFSVDDMMRALSHEGPLVVGTDWKDSMFEPDEDGVLDPSGADAGGHCFLIRGLDLRKKGGPYFRMSNSWGPDWGKKGDAWIRVEDYERYLLPGGDQCVPTERPLASAIREASATQERRTFVDHWVPTGASAFSRTQGMGYQSGGPGKMTGHGQRAGVFKTGPFRMGR